MSGQVLFDYAAQGIEQQLDLAYEGMPELEGIFRCDDVPTNANATVLKSVYVGVFNDDRSEWWGIRESVDCVTLYVGMTRTCLCRHTYKKLATARTLHLLAFLVADCDPRVFLYLKTLTK